MTDTEKDALECRIDELCAEVELLKERKQMSDELYFDVELKKCLDTAGFSDCGENDQWNWWYQRIHRAHDASVDRVTDAQRAENAKLRELVDYMTPIAWYAASERERDHMRELVVDE